MNERVKIIHVAIPKQPKIHKTVTLDRVMAGAEAQMFDLENPGICIACGDDADGCEPDARGYRCESCEERAVYGCEELLLMIA